MLMSATLALIKISKLSASATFTLIKMRYLKKAGSGDI